MKSTLYKNEYEYDTKVYNPSEIFDCTKYTFSLELKRINKSSNGGSIWELTLKDFFYLMKISI